MSETVLHKDAERFAIVTTAENESAFRQQFSEALADLIDTDHYPGDWQYQIDGWMKPAFEIIAKMRGYKADVVEQRTLIAGTLPPNAQIISAGRPSIAEEAQEFLAEKVDPEK